MLFLHARLFSLCYALIRSLLRAKNPLVVKSTERDRTRHFFIQSNYFVHLFCLIVHYIESQHRFVWLVVLEEVTKARLFQETERRTKALIVTSCPTLFFLSSPSKPHQHHHVLHERTHKNTGGQAATPFHPMQVQPSDTKHLKEEHTTKQPSNQAQG